MEDRAEAGAEIDQLIASFFGLFNNLAGSRPNLAKVRELFVREGLIAKCLASTPEISTLEDFIAPRQELLSSGTLTDFEEVETSETTQVFGHIAHRLSTYQKSGVLQGAPFVTRGVKSFQLLETPAGWRILSMTWDDEREDFQLKRSRVGA
jgi:ribosomal-protein-serine acetyltransferase